MANTVALDNGGRPHVAYVICRIVRSAVSDLLHVMVVECATGEPDLLPCPTLSTFEIVLCGLGRSFWLPHLTGDADRFGTFKTIFDRVYGTNYPRQ